MTGPDPRTVAAATLLALPQMTGARLHGLLRAHGGPVAALGAVMRGQAAVAGARLDPLAAAALRDRWADAAESSAASGAIRAVVARRRPHLWVDGDESYPIDTGIAGRPPVLLGEGADPGAFDAPRVAIVGTRSASPQGLRDARALGAFLAERAVVVVSGLAIGIDGAAHEGALAAGGRAIAVVATGLDVVYPRRHHLLDRRVRAAGLVVTEQAYGTTPHPARFPVRNRIIAALADVVVVVEATSTGGARITAGFAAEYGRAVLALPGSRRNPAAAGCNELIADGAGCLLDPDDVMLALGAGRGRQGWATAPTAALPPGARRILDALAGEPATTDQLVARTGCAPAEVAAALRCLVREQCVDEQRGRWWPR